MRIRMQTALAGLAAAMILAVAVGGAAATRFAANEGGFTYTWGALSFSGGGSTITCELTLRGTLHSRTITKTLNSLMGAFTAASVNNCQGDGRATILSGTLPWHITYGGFGGRLPSITTLSTNIIGMAYNVSDGITCLFASTTAEPFRSISSVSAGSVTGSRADETAFIDLQGGFLCELAGDSSARGPASITTAGGGTLTVNLV